MNDAKFFTSTRDVSSCDESFDRDMLSFVGEVERRDEVAGGREAVNKLDSIEWADAACTGGISNKEKSETSKDTCTAFHLPVRSSKCSLTAAARSSILLHAGVPPS